MIIPWPVARGHSFGVFHDADNALQPEMELRTGAELQRTQPGMFRYQMKPSRQSTCNHTIE